MPATAQEIREIGEEYAALKRELAVLFKVGTNKPIVRNILREAAGAIEAEEFGLARERIALARSTAHTATEYFLMLWMDSVRNAYLAIRAQGADIRASNRLLGDADRALRTRSYRNVVLRSFQSFDVIKNMPDEYIDALKSVMKVRYNYTLVESFGLDMTWASGLMEMAMDELNAGNLQKATDLAKNARAEVARINAGYEESSLLIRDTGEAIEKGRRRGVDVARAEAILAKAEDRFVANDLKGAIELVVKANEEVERGELDRIRDKVEGEIERWEEELGVAPRSDTVSIIMLRTMVLWKTEEYLRLAGADMTPVDTNIIDITHLLVETRFQDAWDLLEVWADQLDQVSIAFEERGPVRSHKEIMASIRSRVEEARDSARLVLDTYTDYGMDTKAQEELYERGLVALRSGDVVRAMELFNRATSSMPGDLKARVEADAGTRKVTVGGTPSTVTVGESLAWKLSSKGDRRDEGDGAGRIEAIQAEQVRADVLRRRERAQEIIDRGKTMGADVSEAMMHFAMGNKKQQDGEWERALAYYSEAIDEGIRAGKAITWQGGEGQGQ